MEYVYATLVHLVRHVILFLAHTAAVLVPVILIQDYVYVHKDSLVLDVYNSVLEEQTIRVVEKVHVIVQPEHVHAQIPSLERTVRNRLFPHSPEAVR
jgi:hypothetical protein